MKHLSRIALKSIHLNCISLQNITRTGIVVQQVETHWMCLCPRSEFQGSRVRIPAVFPIQLPGPEHAGRQRLVALILNSLPLLWDTKMEFWATGFGLAQPLLQRSWEGPSR